jgi:hypothetical protein
MRTAEQKRAEQGGHKKASSKNITRDAANETKKLAERGYNRSELQEAKMHGRIFFSFVNKRQLAA